MRAILDSHVLLWWVTDSTRLSKRARSILGRADNDLVWSVASTWELVIKAQLGRLTLGGTLAAFLDEALREQAIRVLPIAQTHALVVETLPSHHRDPFDRMIVAQAKVEGLPILTKDPAIARYDVEVLW